MYVCMNVCGWDNVTHSIRWKNAIAISLAFSQSPEYHIYLFLHFHCFSLTHLLVILIVALNYCSFGCCVTGVKFHFISSWGKSMRNVIAICKLLHLLHFTYVYIHTNLHMWQCMCEYRYICGLVDILKLLRINIKLKFIWKKSSLKRDMLNIPYTERSLQWVVSKKYVCILDL